MTTNQIPDQTPGEILFRQGLLDIGKPVTNYERLNLSRIELTKDSLRKILDFNEVSEELFDSIEDSASDLAKQFESSIDSIILEYKNQVNSIEVKIEHILIDKLSRKIRWDTLYEQDIYARFLRGLSQVFKERFSERISHITINID